MLNSPGDFNKALEQAIEIVITNKAMNNSPLKIKQEN